MLSKINRLTKDKDFERIFREGRFVSEEFLSCKFLKNNLSVSRFGFLVGKKISKKAVERNKVKRRLRAAARNILPRLRQDFGGQAKINSGFDIAIMTKPIIKEKNFQEIELALQKLFSKAKLLK